ncbi:hypothetical protein AAG906_008433 [Vitis piasezkii]
MQCAVAVASSPVFSPSRVSSVFCKSSVSSPDLRKLNLLRSPPPLTPSSSLSLPASPRLHKQEIVHKEFQEGFSVAPTTASKRKRPAKLSIPIIPACCFAVDSPARVERLDEVEVEGEGYSVYCKRGRRAAMEDRYSADVDLGGDSKQAFFGVFDGHGGAKAADFAAKNITKNVMAEVTKKGDEGIEVAIKNGYLATDAEFLKEDVSGGSCCVTALIREGELHVSNAGDCRAVMSRGGIAEALTSDHRPSREDEMDRIQTLGGYVDRCRGVWRIQGSLAVSRGIGDRNLKQWVTAEPETKSLKIKPECEFLILASDGLWDKVTNQEAVDVVRPLCIGVDKPEPFSACKNLARLAIRRGSTDDISVMVIQLSHFLS